MPEQQYLHCDHDEPFLTLHDCVAESAYLRNGILGFEFKDGFWIAPTHPLSDSEQTVRTDCSKVEFTPISHEDPHILVYVFSKSLFGKTIRTELPVSDLLAQINNGKCRLEFLSQYTDHHARIIECELLYPQKPYRLECLLKLSAYQANYYWNQLRRDRVW